MVEIVPVTSRVGRLQLLDTFRFVAALSVVGYHWLFNAIQIGSITTLSYSPLAEFASYGYLGVYLFFLISGFVITASAHDRKPSQYAVRRLVRLYPAFWVCMFITAAVTVFWGGAVGITVPQVLGNLTMVPNVFNQPLVDGVYWTLLHELVFYVLIFGLLFLGLGKRLDLFFPGWALFLVVVTIVAPNLSGVPLFGNLYAFFAGGAILSAIHRSGWTWWRAVGLAASLYVALRYTTSEVVRLNEEVRPFEQSIPITVAVIVACYLLLLVQTTSRASRWVIPQSALLGMLTYPLYLLHSRIGAMTLNHFANDDNKWVVYAVVLLLIIGLSYAVHVLIERLPKKMWFRFFEITAGTPIRWLETRAEAAGDRIKRRQRVEAE